MRDSSEHERETEETHLQPARERRAGGAGETAKHPAAHSEQGDPQGPARAAGVLPPEPRV